MKQGAIDQTGGLLSAPGGTFSPAVAAAPELAAGAGRYKQSVDAPAGLADCGHGILQ